jgi:hypothetical protein
LPEDIFGEESYQTATQAMLDDHFYTVAALKGNRGKEAATFKMYR